MRRVIDRDHVRRLGVVHPIDPHHHALLVRLGISEAEVQLALSLGRDVASIIADAVAALHVAGKATSAVAELTADLATLPTAFRLFKHGVNRTKKGDFSFDEEAARLVKAAADDWGVSFSIDFQHDALNQFVSDADRIAAGWFTPEVRDGELWATSVQWTPRAALALRNKEFRYISPTFRHEEGRVVELINVALTNTPATKGIAPLV